MGCGCVVSDRVSDMVDEWQALGAVMREASKDACFICGETRILAHRNPGIWMCAYGHDDEGRSLTPAWLFEADDAPSPPRIRQPPKPRPFRYGC